MRSNYGFHNEPTTVPQSSIPLSEAMLLGSLRLPQHHNGWIGKDGNLITATCGLAAACDAIGITSKMEADPFLCIDVSMLWPMLNRPATCPDCHVSHDKHGLALVIQHLNDDHKWTRERIAAWVATIEQQLEAAPAPACEQAELAVSK